MRNKTNIVLKFIFGVRNRDSNLILVKCSEDVRLRKQSSPRVKYSMSNLFSRFRKTYPTIPLCLGGISQDPFGYYHMDILDNAMFFRTRKDKDPL